MSDNPELRQPDEPVSFSGIPGVDDSFLTPEGMVVQFHRYTDDGAHRDAQSVELPSTDTESFAMLRDSILRGVLPEDINPGIRRLVELLTISGFKTVDSGDGETHDYACDLPWPFVAVECDPDIMIRESIRLARRIERFCPGLKHVAIGPGEGPLLGTFTVEACYQPFIRRAFITVDGAADKHLAPQWKGELRRELLAWLQG